MKWLFVLLVLLAAQSQAQTGNDRCSVEERSANVDEHQQCVQLVQSRFQTFGSNVCDQLHEQINKCSEIFESCETKEDIRVMKDAQIEIMLKLMNERNLVHLIEECEVVQEYVRSGRVPHKATDKCSPTKVKAVVDKQQDCISNEKSDLETGIRRLNVRSRDQVHKLICNFIDKSLHECSDHLDDCYNAEQLAEIKDASVKIIEKVLDLMGSRFEISKCQSVYGAEPLTDSASGPKSALTQGTMIIGLILAFKALFSTV